MEEFNIGKAYNLVIDKIETWATTAVKMLPNFVIAVLVVIAFWIVAKLVKKLMRKGLGRVTDNQSLVRLMSTIIYVAIIAIGSFVALSVLHLDKAVTSLLAGVGVIGLALGFAFQDIAANFVAGVLIATRKPYAMGDLIEAQGFQGHVVDMNLRSTTIRTFQGQDVIIPNKELFENPLTNFTFYPKRRIDLEVGVSYGDNLESARDIAVEAIESLDCIDKSEGVTLFYTSFGDSSINFVIRFWVDEHAQARFLSARSEGIIAIKKA
ncbi:MAG: mechanosensitive ion channel, partial [Flavobacteriales bacterium]|nr:mechanosensitive ion channel [Flavobacteriales bacterium]